MKLRFEIEVDGKELAEAFNTLSDAGASLAQVMLGNPQVAAVVSKAFGPVAQQGVTPLHGRRVVRPTAPWASPEARAAAEAEGPSLGPRVGAMTPDDVLEALRTGRPPPHRSITCPACGDVAPPGADSRCECTLAQREAGMRRQGFGRGGPPAPPAPPTPPAPPAPPAPPGGSAASPAN